MMELLLNWTFSCGLYSMHINDTIFLHSPYPLVRCSQCLPSVLQLDLWVHSSLCQNKLGTLIFQRPCGRYSLPCAYFSQERNTFLTSSKLLLPPQFCALPPFPLSHSSFFTSVRRLCAMKESLFWELGFKDSLQHLGTRRSGHGIVFNQQKH